MARLKATAGRGRKRALPPELCSADHPVWRASASAQAWCDTAGIDADVQIDPVLAGPIGWPAAWASGRHQRAITAWAEARDITTPRGWPDWAALRKLGLTDTERSWRR